MSEATRIAGIILSGGDSRRMGKPKALLKLEKSTFLETIYDRVLSAGLDPVRIVTGRHHREIAEALPHLQEHLLRNDEPDLGQLHSLRLGLLDVAESCDAVMVCLVDHPRVRPWTYAILAKEFRRGGADIVLPVHEGRRGHPVVFGKPVFGELLTIPLDRGARPVVRRVPERVREVEAGDPGVVVDVDTPDDYETVKSDE